MRHSALKRRPTHHNTNRLPHPGQAARSARKRELQRARRDRIAAEAKRLGITVLEYEYQQWRKVKERHTLKTLVGNWRSQSKTYRRPFL